MKLSLTMISSSKIFLALLIAVSLISCKHKPEEQNKQNIEPLREEAQIRETPGTDSIAAPAVDSSSVVVKTFHEGSGWGYDIFVEEKLYIHQPHIPAVSGNNSFKSEEDAKKIGDFVAYKIRHQIMPPSLTPHELDSLGVTGQ